MPKKKPCHPHLRAKKNSKDLNTYLEYASSSNPVVNLFLEENNISSWLARHFGKKLFWKLLFWLYLVMMLLAPIVIRRPLTPKDLYNIAYIPGFFALFAYAYDRHILPALFWKLYLPVFIITNVYDLYDGIINRTENTFEFWLAVIVGIGFIFFICLGIYNYAFKFLNSGSSKSKLARQ